ncbi:uncharacterized protein LOC125530297 [Triticum urartu]|nr:uncharacterized protein LOC125530297 [Triticum urartu]
MANGGGGGGGGEHLVQITAGGGAGQGKVAAPEKWLNRFVLAFVLMERLGNALGTLAFTWATVVLLGGYASELHSDEDFMFATILIFLEAARMFSRDKNRLDYRLFFNTRGAFRPLGWSGLIIIACFCGILEIIWKKYLITSMMILMSLILVGLVRLLSEVSPRVWNQMRHAASVWSPLVAIVLLAPSISEHKSMIKWAVFSVLLVAVLVATISNPRFTRISKLVGSVLGRKQEFWRNVIINVCMIAALGMLVYMLKDYKRYTMITIEVCALVIVSFGNLQIPAAVVRVILALIGLIPHHTNEPAYDESLVGQKNIKASLGIFYGMVLGQGTLYAMACVFEFFSFIPRRSLVRGGGFKGQWGMKSVNMYYAYASEKCMQGGVLAPKKINLSTFAMDSVNSDSSKNQFAGIRMMHNFLQSQPTKAQLLSKLATSTKTMARIIRMLDWTSPKDTAIRLYAAKVTAELAKNLRAGTIPGTMQLVSALLDADRRLERGNPLLDTDDEHERRQDPVLNTEDSREVADNQFQTQGQLRDTDILLETESRSTQEVGMNKQNSCVLRCWQHISEFWSIPKEQLRTDHDLLPALAMSIIESLAGVDQDNCVEISKAADLIPKIIRFTICRSDTMNTKAQQEILLKSSLKVLQRLTSIGGEPGITLRYKISKHPFLLSNLSGILGDAKSSQISRKLVAGILRNIAVDEKTRQEIGRFRTIITKLMQAFLYSEGTISTNDDHLSRKVAGQALAMLTIQSAQNCLVILKEPWFMKELKILIHDKRYIYVAASLLRNLCLHAKSELRESDLKELSHTLREVLERILDADGAELEILIGLSSQICKVIPEDFTRELDAGQIKQRFAKRLVDTLKANMKPSAHSPGIRRVILEQVIHMMEYNSCYADCFNTFGMTDALSMVEQTPSKAENYRLFLGDEGFMEYSMPLSDLVARAKELMGFEF